MFSRLDNLRKGTACATIQRMDWDYVGNEWAVKMLKQQAAAGFHPARLYTGWPAGDRQTHAGAAVHPGIELPQSRGERGTLS